MNVCHLLLQLFIFPQITKQNDPSFIHLYTVLKSEVFLPREIFHHKNTQWKHSEMFKCDFWSEISLGGESKPLPQIFQHEGEQNRI